MLSCCVVQRSKWQEAEADDEFHDALDHLSPGAAAVAEGRQSPLDMFLLRTGERMFAPVCQDAMPMTDDMLQQQSDILAQLGS